MATPSQGISLIGWREWVGLPALGIDATKAKIDTGARSSALHAWAIEEFTKDGAPWLRFKLHPMQRDDGQVIVAEAALAEYRWVRSSNGQRSKRPVIVTPLSMGGRTWDIELTLTSRDEMGFRMLLGREALRGHTIIDPARSFLCGEPERIKRKKKKTKKKNQKKGDAVGGRQRDSQAGTSKKKGPAR